VALLSRRGKRAAANDSVRLDPIWGPFVLHLDIILRYPPSPTSAPAATSMPGPQPACIQELAWRPTSRSGPFKAPTSKRSGRHPIRGPPTCPFGRPVEPTAAFIGRRELPKAAAGLMNFLKINILLGWAFPSRPAAGCDGPSSAGRTLRACDRRTANAPGPDLLLHDGMQRQRPWCAAKKCRFGKRHGRGTFRLNSGEGGGGDERVAERRAARGRFARQLGRF
jgi:hypothetical protein